MVRSYWQRLPRSGLTCTVRSFADSLALRQSLTMKANSEKVTRPSASRSSMSQKKRISKTEGRQPSSCSSSAASSPLSRLPLCLGRSRPSQLRFHNSMKENSQFQIYHKPQTVVSGNIYFVINYFRFMF